MGIVYVPIDRALAKFLILFYRVLQSFIQALFYHFNLNKTFRINFWYQFQIKLIFVSQLTIFITMELVL